MVATPKGKSNCVSKVALLCIQSGIATSQATTPVSSFPLISPDIIRRANIKDITQVNESLVESANCEVATRSATWRHVCIDHLACWEIWLKSMGRGSGIFVGDKSDFVLGKSSKR